MLNEIRVGPSVSQDGAVITARGNKDGAIVTSDAHGRYAETVIRGNAYFLSLASGAPTAYVGAAGGTPLLAVHNPAGSNKFLAIMTASASIRVTATGAGTTAIGLWAGLSVTPTGTQTSPKSALTFASGGVGLGFSNAALTGSTALNLVDTIFNHYWATAAAAFAAQGFVDIGGKIVLAPGMQFALGATVVPTSITFDVSVFWEEIAI